jgi:hypothetical protein
MALLVLESAQTRCNVNEYDEPDTRLLTVQDVVNGLVSALQPAGAVPAEDAITPVPAS